FPKISQYMTVDKCLIHSVESVLIDWIHELHGVLSRDPSEELLRGTHPTPQTELFFWGNRLADLECIYSQLTSLRAQKMATLLVAVESSYAHSFNSLLRDVLQALEEARDICAHLKPLQCLFEKVEAAQFPEIRIHIAPLMHTVCLLWAHSHFYCRPARIVVLLQEICNLLLQQAHAYLVPQELWRGEGQSLVKLQTTLDLLQLFRNTYNECKSNLSQYQKNGHRAPPWDFPPHLVFIQLDLFMQRLNTVKEVVVTAMNLLKLEKLEIGGVKGRILSQHVQILHQNFVELYKNFTEKSCACLDLNNTEFDADVRRFKLLVEDTDRRLGAIFCQAFDSAPALEHAFKVLDMFGSLLDHPLVAADAVDRYPTLVSMFDQELDRIRFIYLKCLQAANQLAWSPMNKNMPPVAGGLRWVQELRRRIQAPFSIFRKLSYPCLENVAGTRVIQKYEDMMQLLDRCVSTKPTKPPLLHTADPNTICKH
uniref:Dynein heavy chain tail domain-containing protein n=1 Tax=Periophthalmus magnuspinnatus TaxID=409849 RepID=A0A3B4ADU9_9GOBI